MTVYFFLRDDCRFFMFRVRVHAVQNRHVRFNESLTYLHEVLFAIIVRAFPDTHHGC